MPESNLLVEKRQELATKTKLWTEANALATATDGSCDLSRKEVLEKLGAKDAAEAKGKLGALINELRDIEHDVDELTRAEHKSYVERLSAQLNEPIRPRGTGGPSIPDEPRSFGGLVVESKAYRAEGARALKSGVIEVDMSLKTLMQTSAGWQPRTANGDRVVDFAIRPVQLLDFIPIDSTELFEIPFMEETTRTQSAAEVAEAGTYAEDAFAFTRRTSAVRKIGSHLPVTDEQLADVGTLRALLDNRLRFGLRARLDSQIINGDGIAPNLQGLLTVSGIQTQAKGADREVNAIHKAITKVRITGRASPSLVALHGNDWEKIRLSENAQGDYYFGPPSVVGPMSLWGLPVVLTEALPAGTAVVGDFAAYSQIMERKGVEVQVGFVASQFIEGKQTLRADLRAAFVVYRGAAFCKVTGL